MSAFKACLFLAAMALMGSTVAQAKIRVMPLGDSITEITCWRTLLWDALQADGVTNNIQFVGSMTDNTENCQGNSGWDMHHEGHSGYQAINIANNNLVGWLASAKPDVVMFMLGTNDVVIGNHTTSEIIAAYTQMVQEMRASNPNMRIIVDLVIPLGWGNAIQELVAVIPSWAASLSTAQSPIAIADCNTGFPVSDLRDNVHPNAAGDAIIASRIHPVLLNVIRSFSTNPPTTGTGAALWAQCGGIGWTGPNTCTSGTCTYENNWYNQCLP